MNLNAPASQDLQSLEISVQHGIVHLGGDLDSHYELVIALQLASRTSGVLGVRHSIQVGALVEEKITLWDMARAFRRQYRSEIKRTIRFAVAVVVLISGCSSSAVRLERAPSASGAAAWRGHVRRSTRRRRRCASPHPQRRRPASSSDDGCRRKVHLVHVRTKRRSRRKANTSSP